MNSLQVLIADNIQLLEQGIAVLEPLDDATYTQDHPAVALSGAGAHLRHLFDFYQRLFEGLDAGRVDYDARQRDERIERDSAYAVDQLRRVCVQLRALSTAPGQALSIKSDAEGNSPEDAPWTSSSVERELQAVLSHTVHHYALIAVALRLSGNDPGEEFGVAPSTLRYWREQRACAR